MSKKNITTTLVSIVALLAIGGLIWTLAPPTKTPGDLSSMTEAGVSTSTSHYEVEADLPAEGTVGASDVRSYIQSEINEFISDANERAPEISRRRGSPVQFSQNITTDTALSDEFTSYRINLNEYRGGANANSRTETFVFKADGTQLEPDTLIASDQQEEFLDTVRDRLRTTEGTFPEAAESILLPDLNLHITDKTIEVVFSQYQAAPGAAGTIVVSIPQGSYLAE